MEELEIMENFEDEVTFEDRDYIDRYYKLDPIKILSDIHGERFVKYRHDWDAANDNGILPEAPLFIALGVSSDCNLRCKMCIRHFEKDKYPNKHEFMPLDMVDRIVEQAKDINLPSLLIGAESEVFTHPDIAELIGRLKRIDCVDFFVITNGLLMDEEKAKLLIDNRVDRLEISIDAAKPDTYKRIRGGIWRNSRKTSRGFSSCVRRVA